MSSKVAVVILNYNGKKYLEHFLPSVVQNTSEGSIVIADNASTDGSVAFVEENYPTLQVIRMPQNTGFSTGYNTVLRQVDADYYVLLNSDVEVTPHWLVPMVKLMDSQPNIAACQPKIKSFHHKDTFEHAGAGGGYVDMLGFPFCRGRVFDHVEKDVGQYDDTKEVFWASGACMVVRADLYHHFGGLDDDFFAHMEEIDLCWRLKNAGYQIFYCGQSEVYHVGGGTLGYKNPRKLYLNFRNSLVMLVKNLPTHLVFPIVFMRMILDGLAGLHFLSKGSFSGFKVVLQSHFYLYRYLFNILKKRKKARHFAGTDKHKELYEGSIVWQYFIRKKKIFGEILNF
ncbi:MAG: glycosyltransferase family 2 protein [Cytophagales bacterium]|nr:MAG: glycosyltransferase family 2 protein [Cytophagales bacterium]